MKRKLRKPFRPFLSVSLFFSVSVWHTFLCMSQSLSLSVSLGSSVYECERQSLFLCFFVCLALLTFSFSLTFTHTKSEESWSSDPRKSQRRNWRRLQEAAAYLGCINAAKPKPPILVKTSNLLIKVFRLPLLLRMAVTRPERKMTALCFDFYSEEGWGFMHNTADL